MTEIVTMTKEMPVYVSHKRVRALEIKEVGPLRTSTSTGDAVRHVLLDGGRAEDFPADMFTRYVPVPGDFLVVYEDGYRSFSPRKAFLEGYTAEGQSFSDIKQELKR